MKPSFIPVLCGIGFVASAVGLAWYEAMSRERQSEANRLAADLALRLYKTTVDKLTHHQLQVIESLILKVLT